jgi:hypothetical protein
VTTDHLNVWVEPTAEMLPISNIPQRVDSIQHVHAVDSVEQREVGIAILRNGKQLKDIVICRKQLTLVLDLHIYARLSSSFQK